MGAGASSLDDAKGPDPGNTIKESSPPSCAAKQAGPANSTATERKHAGTLIPRTPSLRWDQLEYSAHLTPRGLLRDVRPVFPDGPLADRVVIIPVYQRSSVPLIAFGPTEAAEKDRLLARFVRWASALRTAIALIDSSAWADATDPASGLARFGRTGTPYSDVDGMARVAVVATEIVGGCMTMRHPEWGAACYPTTFFTNASEDVLARALALVNELPAKLDSGDK